MPITRETHTVAWLDPDAGDREATVDVLGVDELRAEREASRAGIRGPRVDARTRTVSDLGDYQNMEALKLWAALVRHKLYDRKAAAFLNEDYIGSKRQGDPDTDPETVDPTRPPENTDSA